MCTTCHWWNTTFGCQNTNWCTDKLTDPKDPVCGGLTYKVIPVAAAPSAK